MLYIYNKSPLCNNKLSVSEYRLANNLILNDIIVVNDSDPTSKSASNLSFGDLIPDTRTPIQKRADGVARAIRTLLADEEARNDTAIWTDLLERRHGLPGNESRGFDTRLRRELIAFINAHAAERDRREVRSYKSFVMDLPLRKTTSAHVFTEMGWWNPGHDDSERYAQIKWLEDQFQNAPLRPQRAKGSRSKTVRADGDSADAQDSATEKDDVSFFFIGIILLILVAMLFGG